MISMLTLLVGTAAHAARRVAPLPLSVATNVTCACGDLCKTPTKQPAHELFGFGASQWQHFDWNQVTTVAWPCECLFL